MVPSSRAKRFCGFFSPAFGVIALSYVWIISGFIIAISGWLQVHQLVTYPVPSPYNTALYFHAIVFTVLGVAGIYGVTAVSLKRHALVFGYLIVLGIQLLLSFGGGIFFLVMVNRVQTSDEIKACMGRVSNNDLIAMQRCYTPIAMHKSAAIAIYVLTWIFELYTWVMVLFCLEDSKQDDAYSDLEKKTGRNGLVNVLSISDPQPIPNFKPATMSMMMGNDGVPISAVHDVVTPGVRFAGGVEQHSWDAPSTPQKPLGTSPPTTPITPSRPDFVSGIKPLLLTKKKKPASQPNSPHVIPPLEISTSPLHPYGLGSAGLSTSYAFSAPTNSFWSVSDQVTPTQAAFTNIPNRI